MPQPSKIYHLSQIHRYKRVYVISSAKDLIYYKGFTIACLTFRKFISFPKCLIFHKYLTCQKYLIFSNISSFPSISSFPYASSSTNISPFPNAPFLPNILITLPNISDLSTLSHLSSRLRSMYLI